MIPIILRLGPITIYSYGLMMAMGVITADFLLTSECRRRGISTDYANGIVVFGAMGGIVGARIYDVFDNWPAYANHPWSIIFSGAGFVWYGGFIGGTTAAAIVSRYYKVPILRSFDMCAPALIIGQAFGRVGCLLSGDGDWGMPSTLPWAMSFPNAIVGWNARTVLKLDPNGNLVSAFFPGVRVHPAPIYESILYTAIFCLMWSIRKKAPEGRLISLYLVLEGTARFMVEFVRVNPRIVAGLSEAQLISLSMVIVGLALLYFTSPRASTIEAPSAIRA
jgi:phosphatidylglycerol---prolipoprotein diacylglyceryl transferase